MATLESGDRLRLVRAEMLEDEIVSVAVARWNSANRLEIFDPLKARDHASRAVTATARGHSLCPCSDRERGEATQHNKHFFHFRSPLNQTFNRSRAARRTPAHRLELCRVPGSVEAMGTTCPL